MQKRRSYINAKEGQKLVKYTKFNSDTLTQLPYNKMSCWKFSFGEEIQHTTTISSDVETMKGNNSRLNLTSSELS